MAAVADVALATVAAQSGLEAQMTQEQWDNLVRLFGTVATEVYDAAAQQANMDAWIGFCVAIVMIFVMIGLIAVIAWMFKNSNEWALPIGLLTGIYALFAVVIVPALLYNWFVYVTNPTWAILMQLSKLVK